LFPVEQRRVRNAALLRSRLGMGWVASGRPPRPREPDAERYVGACSVPKTDSETEYGEWESQESGCSSPEQEHEAICAVALANLVWRTHPFT
jgi:hypothetical protein